MGDIKASGVQQSFTYSGRTYDLPPFVYEKPTRRLRERYEQEEKDEEEEARDCPQNKAFVLVYKNCWQIPSYADDGELEWHRNHEHEYNLWLENKA